MSFVSTDPTDAPSAQPQQPAAAAAHPTSSPSASLYVGELQHEVTEAMLYEIFSSLGPVSSIRICRDAITRRSLGYAYINFQNLADGERALEALNYSLIKGHPCRIMWSQRDPSLRRSGQGNVFIKNLDKTIDNKALHDTFSAFGNILSCKVVCDDQGNSKGFGFVHFETQEAADEAIDKVNGMLLNDIKVFVGRHLSRRERLQQLEQVKANFTNVFVKNLDESVDDEQLMTLFTPFGNILSAVVQKDEQGKSQGFGFINYASHEEAQNAVDGMDGKNISGKEVFVGRAQKKTERLDELRRQFESLKLERLGKHHGVNIYVKNLADSVDDDRLRVEFSPFGNINSCKVMVDEKGISRGFGFVCFSSPEEAARAVTEMNSRMLLGKPLYVALAQRREERRAQLEAQYAVRTQQFRYQQQAAFLGLPPGAPLPTGANIFQQGPMFYPPGSQQPFIPRGAGPYVGGPRPPYIPRPPAMMGRPPMMRYTPRPSQQGAQQFNQGIQQQQQQQPGNYYPRRPNYSNNPGSNRYASRYGGGYAPRPVYTPRPLTAASLASAAPDQQKRLLGERLYPLVQGHAPEQASKITGMLLEMEPTEVLQLIDAPDALHAKVEEAQEVLRKHFAHQQPQSPQMTAV